MKDYPQDLLPEINIWQQFRKSLSSLFPKRKSSIIDLIDSLSSDHNCSSPVELSESELFPRNYSSIYKGINQSFYDEVGPNKDKKKQQRKPLHQLIFSTINQETNLPFHLLGLDATSIPRPHSRHLKDRGCVYQPNTIIGNKPITIGHKYSVLSSLIKDEITNHNWSVPIDGKRITSFDTDVEIGIELSKNFF